MGLHSEMLGVTVRTMTTNHANQSVAHKSVNMVTLQQSLLSSIMPDLG